MLRVEDIYRAVELREGKRENKRRWLGASIIGHECDFFLAAKFRAAYTETFEGRILRLFKLGQDAEHRFLDDLRAAGVEILAYQCEIKAPGTLGHAGATTDGIVKVRGFDLPLVLELKTHSAKSFAGLKDGVRKAKPMHWAQCQFGMAVAELPNAMYLAENKDTSELYLEFIHADQQAQTGLLSRSIRITGGCAEPNRLTDRADDFRCKFCGLASACWGGQLPEVRCTTCVHATAVVDAGWACDLADAVIPEDVIMRGCGEHVFLPWLVPATVCGAGEGSVLYRLKSGVEFANCALSAFPAVTDGDAPLVMTSSMLRAYGTAGKITRESYDAKLRQTVTDRVAAAKGAKS